MAHWKAIDRFRALPNYRTQTARAGKVWEFARKRYARQWSAEDVTVAANLMCGVVVQFHGGLF
jgi:hypothetical protein